jgi:uncharacterized protein CbrC (UPF0167 family)
VTLPSFPYHPDPIASGSVVESSEPCACCGQPRGYLYPTPIYSEAEIEPGLCPWCIADGSAHDKFDCTFVDSEAFPDDTPAESVTEITERTPGYAAWQGEQWPVCCGDATAFLEPAGIDQIRARYRALEAQLLRHIIYELGISGGAATRFLNSLNRDKGPTAYVFRCLRCQELKFSLDQP